MCNTNTRAHDQTIIESESEPEPDQKPESARIIAIAKTNAKLSQAKRQIEM